MPPWTKDPAQPAPRTPGPLGHKDAAAPSAPGGLLGPTPGPLGINDHATVPQQVEPVQETLQKPLSTSQPPPPAKDAIALAFDQCQQQGWIPFFQDAAKANSFDPELLMAIGYRESHLDPKYLKVPGDSGNGYGLMQVDIRSYRDWVAAGDWKDAESCISKGSEILSSKRDDVTAAIGQTDIKVKTLAGQTYTFDGKPIQGADLLRVTVAAYNCGMWAYYHYSNGHDVDRGTTGQDYSKDVLANATRFQQLLNPSKDSTGWTDLPSSFKNTT
jgi:hypothetical protein